MRFYYVFCVCRGTLHNGGRGWLGREELLNRNHYFSFFHTKSILVASQIYGWTTDVTWTILLTICKYNPMHFLGGFSIGYWLYMCSKSARYIWFLFKLPLTWQCLNWLYVGHNQAATSLPLPLVKPTQKWLKLQFINWLLEAGSKRESIP